MKFTKILFGTLAAASLGACADLDTEILDNYVSTEQKQETLTLNPQMASASVMGVYSQFSSIFTVYEEHYDFGYPAIMMSFDSQGVDYISKNSGYNWFFNYNELDDNSNTGVRSNFLWHLQYKQIGTVNTLIGSIPADTDNDELKFFRAQGLATRSFDYWTLAQVYAFNYTDHKTALCVPVITDENSQEAALNGAPRATVEEVYVQIMKDINEAITLLENTKTKASDVVTNKPKRCVTLAAAYGLRARYNLTMGLYADAANDAEKAIAAFSGKPYSMEDVSKPTFTSINDDAWMWGIAIDETQDGITGGSIVNFPAMSCSFSHGYCDQGGAWRWCSKVLYDWIPNTDVRKGWFLDANRKSRNLSKEQQAYLDKFVTGAPTYGQDASTNLMPYTNVKFDSYQGVLEQSLNASDIPLMRIEEMYLIKAEGLGMSSNLEGGKQALTDFVRTYRDPGYACTATTATDFQDEVWRQRRVELWGEGLSYFDIMRLKKPIDRRGAMYPVAWRYNVPYESPIMLFLVPDSEMSANKAITENNELGQQPTPAE